MGKRVRRLIHRYLGCPLRGIRYQVDPQAAQGRGVTQVRGYGINCEGCERFWHGDSPWTRSLSHVVVLAPASEQRGSEQNSAITATLV
jgi:hypothetical protein